MPPPPGWGTTEAATDARFARFWIRHGASLLDSITVTVLTVVWVNTDGERRSAYDRIAGTRVVYKSRL